MLFSTGVAECWKELEAVIVSLFLLPATRVLQRLLRHFPLPAQNLDCSHAPARDRPGGGIWTFAGRSGFAGFCLIDFDPVRA